MTDQIAYRDRDFEFSVYLTYADTGLPVNLTDSTWELTLRRNFSEDILLTATISNAKLSLGSPATAGQIIVAFTAAEMAADGGRFVAELKRTDTGADTYSRWYVSCLNPGQVMGGDGNTITKPFGNIIARIVTTPGAVAAVADVTAPTLSGPTTQADSDTTGSGSVTTDEGNGTLYFVVTTSVTAPTALQVHDGEDHLGNAATDSGSQAVSATGPQAISGGFIGLSASTTYYAHFMHEDAAANRSAVVSSASFTTDADDAYIPTLDFSIARNSMYSGQVV